MGCLEAERMERPVEASDRPSVVQGVVMGEFADEMHSLQMIHLKSKFRRVLAFLVLLVGILVFQHGEWPLAIFFWAGSVALWWRSLYP